MDDESYTPRNETTAFILTSRINRGNARIGSIATIYELPKLNSLMLQRSVMKIGDLYQQIRPHVKHIDCWDRVRPPAKVARQQQCCFATDNCHGRTTIRRPSVRSLQLRSGEGCQ